jgi:alpha-L-rhamnosidase
MFCRISLNLWRIKLQNLTLPWRIGAVLIAMTLLVSSVRAESMSSPLASKPDPVGQTMQGAMIWAAGEGARPPDARFVAFRKEFGLLQQPKRATLRLFADLRYLCWINGRYVARGPVRFNPLGPEYDVVDITQYLNSGNNFIAVVVMANASNGKMMRHAPGLTVKLEAVTAGGSQTTVITDESWKWTDRTRYRPADVNWGNVGDRIDATVEDGDWTQPQYDDTKWRPVVHIDGQSWGPLTARRIPMLRETPLDAKPTNGQTLPITLTAGQEITFDVGRMSQAYTTLDLDASAGAAFNMNFPGVSYHYIARAGRQSYMSSDTCGMKTATFTIKSGTITLNSFKPVECLYPFDCVGSFHSSDSLLDSIWSMSARSLQLLSEDAYVDCADRERTEWMDCDPPDFDVTRTAMAGPGPDGGKLYGDPRLLEEMIRRTALTLQPDGWVKAHTCSDRFDIHALMEDRSCDWVEGARRYYDSSGNAAPVREIWPVITRQMKYFLDRRTERGLVNGREWVYWRNPMSYVTCEGAGLNAFVYRALVDAAYLGNVIGEKQQAAQLDQAAKSLRESFNKVLWDEKEGTYYAGFYTKGNKTKAESANFNKVSLNVTDGLVEPTMSSALIALDQGIVPDDRRASVSQYLLAHRSQSNDLMQYYYLFNQLYQEDDAALDREVLHTIRTKWKPMAEWGTSWEAFDGGSKAHCYGMFPGYFLSAYVLGVRLDGPVANKHLLIDPRLGDLTAAEGTVVTEFGPVPISWKNSSDRLEFEFQVPDGASATLRLPSYGGKATLVLDEHSADSTVSVQMKSGRHKGTLTFPVQVNTGVSPRNNNFSDDFTKGNSHWQEGSGAWKVDSGTYTQTDDSVNAVSGVKDVSWSDAAYEFTCQIKKSDDPGNWAGFGFRKPAPANNHDDGGYLLYRRANGDLELYAGKILESIKTDVDSAKPLKLRVVAIGDHIQVYINDEASARIDVHDSSFSEGYFGFETNHVQASFGAISAGMRS